MEMTQYKCQFCDKTYSDYEVCLAIEKVKSASEGDKIDVATVITILKEVFNND